MHGGGYRVDETLICVGREIGGDLRGGRDGSCYFDVQLDFAVGAARIIGRRVCAAVDGDCGDFWSGDAEIFEK